MKVLLNKLKKTHWLKKIFYVISLLSYWLGFCFFCKSLLSLVGIETTIRVIIMIAGTLFGLTYTLFGLKKMVKEKRLLSFYTQKAIYTFGDGTYFAPAKLEREPLYSYKIKDYFLYSNHGKNKIYHIVAQTQHVLMLFFIILGLIFSSYLDKRQRYLQMFLNGVFLFLLLWETRSRYLVNFIPVFLLSAYLGMVAAGRFFLSKQGHSWKDLRELD